VTDIDIAARRTRLAALEATLARSRAQYDVLMNAFRFEAARMLALRIEADERERRSLAATLPAAPEPALARPYAVAPRRRRRR
jgi:hypothetical protein